MILVATGQFYLTILRGNVSLFDGVGGSYWTSNISGGVTGNYLYIQNDGVLSIKWSTGANKYLFYRTTHTCT